MTDYIYNSITEMPDDVLKNEIYEAEKLYKEWPLILARWHLQILKDELVRRQRQPDSLYVTTRMVRLNWLTTWGSSVAASKNHSFFMFF